MTQFLTNGKKRIKTNYKMISLLNILKEEVTSIPIHNISKSAEKVYRKIKSIYPNVPEYIIKDYLNNKDYSGFSNYEIMKGIHNLPGFIVKNYKLKILNVNPLDFTDETVDWFIERNFGENPEPSIPDDKKRTRLQRKFARSDGRNEPIVVIKRKDGKYELIEGWHRTMAILRLGDNGEDLKSWSKVKIRAFVSEE